MSTVSHITTAEQLEAAGDIGRCELVRGELIMMSPTSSPHARAVIKIGGALDAFVSRHDLGRVYGGDPGFIIKRNPDTVLGPDVAFVKSDRLHLERARGFFPGPPDLAVEVVSPDDSPREVREKTQMWLKSGCRSVWVADPQQRTITVHRAAEPARIYREGEVLSDEPLLSGFALTAADAFS